MGLSYIGEKIKKPPPVKVKRYNSISKIII
nr:MAG TPA: hypothetical protein [Caudoviricetes sp.]